MSSVKIESQNELKNRLIEALRNDFEAKKKAKEGDING